jgi:hypothetical protein
MELRQAMSDEFVACQQPFNTLPKFPTDAEQDFRPNLHLAGCHRGENYLSCNGRLRYSTKTSQY